jgi:hypothetical protein
MLSSSTSLNLHIMRHSNAQIAERGTTDAGEDSKRNYYNDDYSEESKDVINDQVADEIYKRLMA